MTIERKYKIKNLKAHLFGLFFFYGIILLNRTMSYFPKTKRYIKFFLPLLLGVILYFGLDVEVVHAAEESSGFWSSAGNAVGGALLLVLNGILYGVFVVVSYPVTWAAILLGWAVDPAAVQTLFTMNSIYLLWQMIRDFFNLFFILTLLFIAFATIFQIDSFNYKKTLGKLLLMALLVNFSFPIARFIIDATNVPMYFFMESMFTDKSQANGKGIVEVSFGSSGMQEIILPGSNTDGFVKGDSDLTVRIFTGIIFMFLFGVSLLVFAIMMVIRSIMLVVLIIFSPVGFAGMVIPGFRQYATKWWDNLLKYAMFGPASMLMMLVAVKFMQEFKVGGKQAMIAQASGATVDADAATYIATMASIVVPIVLIWTAITIGQTMGIAGAGMVTSRAQQFSKWAGRKASGADAVGKRWKAYSSERDKRGNEKFAANNVGTKLGSWANTKLDKISASRTGQGSLLAEGALNKETAAARQARSRYMQHQKEEVDKKTKEHMIGGTMTDERLKDLHKQARNEKDKSLLAATTKEMSKRESTAKDVSSDDMKAINAQFVAVGGVRSAVADEVKEEVAKKNAAVAYDDDETAMAKAFAGGKIKIEDQTANGLTTKLIQAANAAGKLDQKMLEEMRKDTEKKGVLDTNLVAATKATEAKYQADVAAGTTITDDQTKARTRMHQLHVAQTGDFHGDVISDITLQNSVFKKADAGTLKNMSPALMRHYRDQIADNMQIGKITNAVSEISETNDVAAQALVNELKAIRGTNARAQKAVDALGRDHRTGAFV